MPRSKDKGKPNRKNNAPTPTYDGSRKKPAKKGA
jgi:hypothetical protein